MRDLHSYKKISNCIKDKPPWLVRGFWGPKLLLLATLPEPFTLSLKLSFLLSVALTSWISSSEDSKLITSGSFLFISALSSLQISYDRTPWEDHRINFGLATLDMQIQHNIATLQWVSSKKLLRLEQCVLLDMPTLTAFCSVYTEDNWTKGPFWASPRKCPHVRIWRSDTVNNW